MTIDGRRRAGRGRGRPRRRARRRLGQLGPEHDARTRGGRLHQRPLRHARSCGSRTSSSTASAPPARHLPLSADPVVSVRWAADSRWLACEVATDGGVRTAVWVVRPDGSDARRVAGDADEHAELGPVDPQRPPRSSSPSPGPRRASRPQSLPRRSRDRPARPAGRRRADPRARRVARGAVHRHPGRRARTAVRRRRRPAHRRGLQRRSPTARPAPPTSRCSGRPPRTTPVPSTSTWPPTSACPAASSSGCRFGPNGWRGEPRTLAARDDAELECIDADDAGRLLLLVWNVAGSSELELLDTATRRADADRRACPVSSHPTPC